MAGRPLRRARSRVARTLPELVDLIGPGRGYPILEMDVLDAFQEKVITADEARVLQAHARLAPRAQKRALRTTTPVPDAEIAAMRAKLEAQMERFRAAHPNTGDRA